MAQAPLKPGDVVVGPCQPVGNLPPEQLAAVGGRLAEVPGSGVTAKGKLFLASRKQAYKDAFAAQGLAVCDDDAHRFARAGNCLRLSLGPAGEGAVYVWGEGQFFDTGAAFVALRLKLDGTPDTAFGRVTLPGSLITETAGEGSDWGQPVAGYACGTPDGGLLATGTIISDTAYVKFMARFRPDGSLDTTFGTGGLVIVQPLSPGDDLGAYWYDGPTGIRLRPDGSGRVGLAVPVAADLDSADGLATWFSQYDAGGALVGSVPAAQDPSLPLVFVTFTSTVLSGGGFAALPFDDVGHDVPYLAVYNPDGSFSAQLPFPPAYFPDSRSLAGLPDGGFLFLAVVGTTMTLTRYAAGGAVSWAVSKEVAPPSEPLSADVAVRSDGRIVAALIEGFFGGTGTIPLTLYGFNADGTDDASFGSGGLVTAGVDVTGMFVGSVDRTGVAVALP